MVWKVSNPGSNPALGMQQC